jgi:hypothetical protein
VLYPAELTGAHSLILALRAAVSKAPAPETVSAYGWKALTASVIGYAMDGFDLLILGFLLTAISGDLGLTTPQAGSLVTWTLAAALRPAGGFSARSPALPPTLAGS